MMTLDTPHANKLPPLDYESDDGEESFDDTEYQMAMGSRPEIPTHIALDESYNQVLSIFYACTSEDSKLRPSAKALIDLIEAKNNDDEENNVPA
jgi:hypothetical protein